MNQRDLAQYVTAAVVNYWRFNRQLVCVATEVGEFCSDILGYDEKGNIIETEVKVSRSDFKAEFKKFKHEAVDNTATSKFYFAVPREMSSWAKAYLEEKEPKWGLIVVSEWGGNGHCVGHVRIIKTAKKLKTNEEQVRQVKKDMMSRATSQLASLLEDRVRSRMGKIKCPKCKAAQLIITPKQERKKYGWYMKCPACNGEGYVRIK